MRKLFNIFGKSNEGRYSLHRSVERTQNTGTLTAGAGLNLYQTSLYLQKGIMKRGEKVGETQFVLRKRGSDDIITKHVVLDLLDKPNKTMTGDQFWKMACEYKDATGFAVIRKKGKDSAFSDRQKTSELEILNSGRIQINYTGDKTAIESFTYTNLGGKVEVIPFDECIYWYTPDLKNELEGMSIITAGLYSVLTEKEMLSYQNAVLRNGGTVDGILSFKNTLTKDQLAEIKEGYKREHGDSKSAGTPMVLGGDAQYTKLSLNPQELDYIASRGLMVDDIVTITGVPKAIMGLTSGETFSNADVAYRIFLRETIRPLVRDLVNVLDWRLIPEEYDLDFIDPTPEDVEQKIKIVEVGDRVRALTVNEKREMLGFEEIKGGDEITTPQPVQQEKAGVYVHPLRNKDFRANYHKGYKKSLDGQKRRFKKELSRYFKGQEERLLKQITARKQVKTKSLVDEIFNVELEIVLATPLLRALEQVAKEAGQEAMNIFAPNREYVYGESIDTAVNKRFDFFAESVNSTTAETLKKEVSEWIAEEGTVKELIERVKETYGDIEDWRATTIANTEVASIMQEAKMDSYNQIGIKTKVWVWSAGIQGGVRDDHIAIDGEEQPIEQPFTNGLMYPHDPMGGAEDTINCECTV